MKLHALFEMAEKLDRSQYGEWIGPDNTIHPLRGLEHAKWYVIYVLKKRVQDIDSLIQVLRDAYKDGWVRVAHPVKKGMLFVDAYRRDMKRVAELESRAGIVPEDARPGRHPHVFVSPNLKKANHLA